LASARPDILTNTPFGVTPFWDRTLWGYPVIDGDGNDLRFLDPAPCIVALKAKGAGARRDTTGFVLDANLAASADAFAA
jgi:hypothetical protein